MHEVTLRARWAAWVARAESPAHPSGLVAFRILFGLLATFGALRFEWNGWVERSFQAPTFFFHYWGFSWVQPLSIPQMHALFITMAICGLCIALGLFYRVAAIVYFLAFTYVELCDVTNYLNHYYLQSILALLLCVLPLHRVYSLDAKLRPSIRLEHFPGTENSQHYPRYFTWLLRAQLTLVYFFAAMAKFTPDWLLHGQPMQIWLHARTDAPLVGPLFDMPYVPLAMSWAGFLYDLTIPFWLLHPKTRTPAYGVVLLFHAFTKLLFPIGLFPVIMTVGTLVFFPYDWPVLLQRFALRVRGRFASPYTPFARLVATPSSAPHLRGSLGAIAPADGQRETSRGLLAHWPLMLAGAWCVLQFLLPLRTHAYGGNVLWHEQGMRWSWRVMAREKNGSVTFRVRSADFAHEQIVRPGRYLNAIQEREMAVQPDLIVQLAHHIAADYRARGHADAEVRVDAYCSLNGRPMALLIDPEVDLARVEMGLGPAPWILPAPDGPPPSVHRAQHARLED
jgi:uncharacterized membrane protein YphA (DoxX/SURF4 family)